MLIPSKVNYKKFKNKIRNLIDRLSQTNNNTTVVITEHYGIFETDGFTILHVNDATPEFIVNNAHLNFVYAVENNSLGLPIIDILVKNNINFYAAPSANVGGYVYDNKLARDTIEEEYENQEKEKFSKFHDPGSEQDFINLCQAIDATKNIEGDIVEIGVYRGSSSSVILNFLRKIKSNKNVFFFDTFEGFDYVEAYDSVDQVWKGTHITEGYNEISNRLLSRAYKKNKVVVKRLNVISENLPSEITKISLCNVDVDMLEAVDSALTKVAPLMTIGGILICEDAGHTPALIGARYALEKFLNSSIGKTFTPIHMPSGQVFLIKHQ